MYWKVFILFFATFELVKCRGDDRTKTTTGISHWYYHCLRGLRCKPCVFLNHQVPHISGERLSSEKRNKEDLLAVCRRNKVNYIFKGRTPSGENTEQFKGATLKLEKASKSYKLSTYGLKISQISRLVMAVKKCSAFRIYFGDYDYGKIKKIVSLDATFRSRNCKQNEFELRHYVPQGYKWRNRRIGKSKIRIRQKVTCYQIRLNWNDTGYVGIHVHYHKHWSKNVSLEFHRDKYGIPSRLKELTLTKNPLYSADVYIFP